MNNMSKAMLVCFIVPFFLSGCGGGGGTSATASSGTSSSAGPTLSGSFVDAPVDGLSYSASPSGLSGTTNAQGLFTYKSGDTVSFTAAGVSLGSAAPSIATDGSVVVTPLTLTGETSAASAATAPKALAIASLLSTLNSASVAKGGGVSGAYVIPPGLNLASTLGSQISTSTTLATMTSAVNAAASTSISTPQQSDVLSGLQQGVGTVGIAGTIWRGDCGAVCGGGTVFFNADGTAVGITDDGGTISGSWSVTPGTGATTISLVSSGGGTANGSIAAGATSGSLALTQTSGTTTLAITRISGSGSLSSTYSGLWYVTFTPNAAGTAAGFGGGSAVIMAAADGKIYGTTDSGSVITGTWNPATGAGTATSSNGGQGSVSATVDFSAGSGTLSSGGTNEGALSFARSGTFSIVKSSGRAIGGNLIPLLLNLRVTWANKATSASSFALDAHVDDALGNRVGSTVRSEVTALRTDGVPTVNTDNIAVSYPTGSGVNYVVTFGSGSTTSPDGKCTIGGNTGAINDSTSGSASAHTTVTVTCS